MEITTLKDQLGDMEREVERLKAREQDRLTNPKAQSPPPTGRQNVSKTKRTKRITFFAFFSFFLKREMEREVERTR